MSTPITINLDRSRTDTHITTSLDLQAVLDDFDTAITRLRDTLDLPINLTIDFDRDLDATVQLVTVHHEIHRDVHRDIVVDSVYHIDIADTSSKDTAPYTISKQINTQFGLSHYRATMFVFAGARADDIYDQMQCDIDALYAANDVYTACKHSTAKE